MPVHAKSYQWLAAGTIFLSAFLLFQVQPLISKAILPWFGGSPAVWTTCLLFFQVGLLVGYAYADRVARLAYPRAQPLLHSLLLIAAASTLSIVPSESWKPQGGGQPTLHILQLLLIVVGLPYVMLATTGPLIQAWYARTFPGASPYRLYALSNVGSLAALVTYPLLMERAFTTRTQGYIWSGLFVAFAVGSAVLGWLTSRHPPLASDLEEPEPVSETVRPRRAGNGSHLVARRPVAGPARPGRGGSAGSDQPLVPRRGRRAVSMDRSAGLVSAELHHLF
jgi:hypothetical protein